MFRTFAIACLALLASACATYPTMATRTKLLAPTTLYFAPPAGGRAPLVIIVSGCGGLIGEKGYQKQVSRNYAKAATEAGAYVVVFDSFSSRDISFRTAVNTVCSGLQLRGDSRAGDILAAEQLARDHFKQDFSGVVLAGWSHGGWTVMELLANGPDAGFIGNLRIDNPRPKALAPDAVALWYPYCGLLSTSKFRDWKFKGPLLLLTAGEDSRSTAEQCREEITKARGGPDNIEFVNYPNNTHAFDEEDQIATSDFKYDPEATRRSLALFTRFVTDQVTRLK